MKKGIKFVLGVVVIVGVYIAFLFWQDAKQKTGHMPTIEAPTDVLEVSVEDKDTVLLEGVTASDEEDGDLTSEVYVESLSTFDEDQCRTVTYAVFDSDDNLSRTTRKIRYTDYEEPEIDVTQALYYYYYISSTDEYKDYVSASSVVDGDISSKIAIDNEYMEDENQYVTYSVTDSCGTKVTLTLKIDQLNTETNVDITLSQYLLRVKKGTTINPRDYIKTIKIMGMEYNSLKSIVEIQNDYNADEPGMYEFVYRLSRTNGDYGITKLVVIVEE